MKTLTLTTDIRKLKLDQAGERAGLPSASSAPRLAPCPGSWRMEMNLQDLRKYAEDADSGTRVHDVMAGKPGQTLDPAEQRMVDGLGKSRDRYVSEWEDSIQHEVAAAGATGDETLSIEERWWLHAGVTPVTSGKWDHLERRGNAFLLLDYKTGWQELPALRSNLQLRVYALLVYQKHPEAESITVAIVKGSDYEQEKLWTFTYTRADLEAAWFWWQNVLNNVFSDNPPLVSGDHCQFCRAQSHCPARMAVIETMHLRSVESTPWAMLDPYRKGHLLSAAIQAAKLADAIKEQAKADLKEGIPVNGFYLGKESSAGTDVDDIPDAYQRWLAAGGTHDEFMECASVSFSQLRDKLAAKKAWKKKDANDSMKATLGGKVTAKTKGGSLTQA